MQSVVTTAEFLNMVALIAGLTAVILLIASFVKAKRGQKAAYYAVRREAQRTATSRLALSLTFFAISIGVFIVGLIMPHAPEPAPPEIALAPPAASPNVIVVTVVPTAQATPTHASSLAPAATATIRPTLIVITVTAPETPVTIAATATPPATPATPSPLPTATATSATRLPPGATSTLPPGKRLTLRAISSAIDASGAPISPTTEFTSGVASIYIFFDYHNVTQGAVLRVAWFCDGSGIHYESIPWTQTGAGSAYVSWAPKLKFSAGLYEVRLMLGDVNQFTANFMVH
jgi:hypothetical protein